jgi:hypothetical protein
METLKNKTEKLLLRLSLICLCSFLFSASMLFAQKNIVKYSDPVNKKLDILENLEKGKKVSGEEIRNSFSKSSHEAQGSIEFYMPDLADDLSLTEPFHYRYNEGNDHWVFSGSDMSELNDQLHKSLEEVRRNIESFRNSDEFKTMQTELQKWSEKFRKEMGKIKVEISL